MNLEEEEEDANNELDSEPEPEQVNEDELDNEFDVQEEEDDDDEEDEDEIPKQELQANYTSDEKSDFESDYDSVEDDDESEDENEFYTRIDSEMKNDFIRSVHPEELQDSVNEMNAASVVYRNNDMFIVDENHKTYPFLTKYERAKVLGLRITQLNKGAQPLIQYESNIIDNHLIAERELKEKQIPFIIMRPLPNGKKEYWRLQDLEIIDR